MKEIFVHTLKKDDVITEFFMVKTINLKVGSNKKQYLDVMLGDSGGEISAKKWDVSDEELPSINNIKEGDLVKIKAQVTEWNGMKQLKILKIRLGQKEDNLDIRDYIKAAPEKPEDMYNFIMNIVEEMKDKDLKAISQTLMEENKEKLMYYPAAHKNHHAQLGGLLYHMKRMIMSGYRLCEVYNNLNRDLVCTGVIMHDMEKIREIEANTLGIASGYSFEGMLLGHIVQGVKSIDRLAERLGVPREKTIMLEHMILSHHYEPEFGSPKRPAFPEAEVLHYVDVLDARLFDMEEATMGIEKGQFSDRVWTLENRKVYKPIWEE